MVRGGVGVGDHGGAAETGERETRQGHPRGGREGDGSQAHEDQDASDAGHQHGAERVDQAVSHDATHELCAHEAHVPEAHQAHGDGEHVPEVDGGPVGTDVLHEHPGHGDHRDGQQSQQRGAPSPGQPGKPGGVHGEVLRLGGGVGLVVVRHGPPHGQHGHGGEDHPADEEVPGQGHVQGGGRGAHEPADHGTHAPQGVHGVDHRGSGEALDPQSLGVLGGVHHRVQHSGDEQSRPEHREDGDRAGHEDRRGQEHGAHGRGPGGAEPAQDGRGQRPGHHTANWERDHRQPVRRVGELEHVLELGQPREQVGEDRAVREEQQGHGQPGTADARAVHGFGVGGRHPTRLRGAPPGESSGVTRGRTCRSTPAAGREKPCGPPGQRCRGAPVRSPYAPDGRSTRRGPGRWRP